MSDQKSSYGEPVEEPTTVHDDVVGRAHEGLADADAVRREAAAPESAADVPAADGPVFLEPAGAAHPAPVTEEPVPAEPATVDPAVSYAPGNAHEPAEAPVAQEPAASEPSDAERSGAEPAYAVPAYAATSEPDDVQEYVPGMYSNPARADDATVVAPVVPVVAGAATASAVPQPIFVQAPEAPLPRGNRGAAGAIGLLAALAFAVLYLAAWLGFGAITGAVTVDNVGSTALAALGTWSLWVTVAVFFFAFWLLGAIINRGRWGVWVNVGLLVGVASYGGHILGQLFQAPFWTLTATEGRALVEGQLLAPLAIAAFIIGRELTIWFGAWVAARGARVTELNIEAQREYERTLEAGPQLVRQ
ncbi:ABC transporter [Microbacterium rhizomatis]|uniref:ABC transporter n=1 Tax=Microbacterium rhizomatis TaxID=1631477 RepID=A0A5J5J016_9MICO|nr:ABC transporter [Microbacterium rhizomatis]KAA9107855.1 ABC transporter [Microbacterium rhizomatis]